MKPKTLVLLVILVGAGAYRKAFADSIPAATFYGAFPNISGAPSLSQPGTITGAEGCGTYSACATSTVTINPYIGGTAAVSGNGSNSGYAAGTDLGQAQANFYVEVVGATPNQPVYLDLTGQGTTTATTGAVGNAFIYADAVVTGGPIFHACSSPGSSACMGLSSSFSGVEYLTAYTDRYFYIEVSGDGETATTTNGSWSFSVDPMVTFDPSQNTSGLTLEFSPNVGALPTPEPPTLSFVMIGLGVLGFGLLRRRVVA